MPATSTRFGVLCVLASTAFFSLTATFVVNAYDSGANPVGVLTVRFAIASVFMVAARRIVRPNRADCDALRMRGEEVDVHFATHAMRSTDTADVETTRRWGWFSRRRSRHQRPLRRVLLRRAPPCGCSSPFVRDDQ